MLACGGVSAALAAAYTPYAEPNTEEIQFMEPAIPAMEETLPESIEKIATSSTAQAEEWVPSLDAFNLVYFFPDGADTSNIAESYAYDAFQALMARDSGWMSDIYEYSDLTPAVVAGYLGLSTDAVTGGYDPTDNSHDRNDPSTWTIPSFRTVRVSATDGDGNAISPRSNVFELMSMANTYTYYQGVDDYDLFLSYSMALWELSHSYTIGISDVYYCSGCVGEDAQEHEWEALKAELTEEEREWSESPDGEEDASKTTSIRGGDGGSFEETTESEEESLPEHRSTVIRIGSKAETSDGTVSGYDTELPGEETLTPDETGTEASAAVASDGGISDTEASDGRVSGTIELTEETSERSEMTEWASETLESAEETSEASELDGEAEAAETPEFGGEAAAVETSDTEIQGADAQSAAAESRESSKASDSNLSYCPGHVDLIVHVKITGLSETTNNLFSLDTMGNDLSESKTEGDRQWPGWVEETRMAARNLAALNWYEQYGLSISVLSPGNPLTPDEMEAYMALLPDTISETRRELVRFALGSVGKVPYYWAGKASQAGYEGNQFGTPVSPDVDGRIRKGLDCSGWISWVYWSVTGERLPYESTAGLIFAGTKISREELLPGDIIIRTGSEAHVVMFLDWNPDGTVLCINETSGTDNNVVVASREANWPYYRKLVD